MPSSQPSFSAKWRNWPMLLGLGLIKAACKLPTSWLLATGRGLGWLSWRLIPRRRHIVDVNLKLCFPELSDAERRALAKAHLQAFGMGIFETALAWWGSDKRIRSLGEVKGIKHLHDALASGKGVILLTGHFTTLEMGARLLTYHQDFHPMYRPQKNPVLQDQMRRIREQRSRMAAIPRDDIRAVLRALREGRVVWYAPDQHMGRNAVFVSFFGIPARTITATSRLARSGNAVVVPYFPARLADGRYRITVQPPLENFPSDDDEADTRRINELIEDWVRQVPEQYFWVHRRFRDRPEGEAPVY